MRYLFVGGVHDGYEREVPDGYDRWSLRRSVGPVKVKNREQLAKEVKEHLYNKTRLEVGTGHTVFALDGLGIDDIMRRLLNQHHKVGERTTELEFLRFFYKAAGDAFGPADADIYQMIAENFEAETDKELPEEYK